MVQYWPAHCAELERAGPTDAIHCWWFAAEEISRYATEGLLADDVRELRMQWLWRGARLSLRASTSRPLEPVPPSVEAPSPRKIATPPPPKKKLAKARVRKPKSAGARKLRKNEAAAAPAALHADKAALPLVEPTRRTLNGNRVISGFQRRQSRNSAERPDWYR